MHAVRLVAVLAGIALFATSAARADTATYAYDGQGRLTGVTYANGTTITYQYDLAGNRLGEIVTCSSSGC